jgi:hypothetical protein
MTNKLYILVVLALIITSCKKVVDIDLNEANPRIVVDAQIHFADTLPNGFAYLHLHMTSSFYELKPFNIIDSADVKIIDKNGLGYKLSQNKEGIYINTNLPKAGFGDSYKLNISVNGKIISANSTIARPVKIDSLNYKIDDFGPHQGDGYVVTCFFMDPPNEVNYYYLKIMYRGEYQYGYFLTRDDGFDGKQISYAFFRNKFVETGKVQVELYTIDEASFEYYKVLAMMEQGGMSTAPGNPPSNIEGDAIGLFNASFVDTKIIYIP